MSHVDDGELTAYADGAYPANDPDALRISAHLSACDNCRTRLEQAHVLRDRTAQILGFATPGPASAPPFETLEAKLSTSSRPPRRHINLAWAASIMLALGLGWFGRGAWQDPPMRGGVVQEETLTASDAAATVAAAPSAQAPAPQPSPQVASETRAAPRQSDRAQVLGAAAAREETAVGATVGVASAAARTPAATPPPAAAAPSLAEADLAADAVANRQYMSAADAERRGINVPRIPELPVARIAMSQDTTFVEQSLPDGRVVRLTVMNEVAEARRERRSAGRVAAPEMAQVQKSVVPNVTIRQGDKVILVTGPLPEDSLRALAAKIR